MKRVFCAVLLAAALSSCVTAPEPPASCGTMEEGVANLLARTFAIDQEPQGTVFENMSIELYADGPTPSGIWRFKVDAIVVHQQANQPGGVVKVPSHWIIDVDQCTAHATVFAQG